MARKQLRICSCTATPVPKEADAAARRVRGSALTEMQLGGAGEAGEAAGAALQALTCYNRPARVAYLRELVQALLDGKAQARAPAPGIGLGSGGQHSALAETRVPAWRTPPAAERRTPRLPGLVTRLPAPRACPSAARADGHGGEGLARLSCCRARRRWSCWTPPCSAWT